MAATATTLPVRRRNQPLLDKHSSKLTGLSVDVHNFELNGTRQDVELLVVFLIHA